MNSFVFENTVYQEPAVIYSGEGQTLLVFAGWKTKTAKASSQLLVMKRGVVSRDSNGITLRWLEKRFLEEARLDGHRSTTPCPVYDRKNDKLFLFFTCVEDTETQEETKRRKTRLCFITSKNLGETWSEVTDLTKHLQKNCTAFYVGLGHGLQTNSGRLIVPAHVYNQWGTRMVALYSDDSGERWQFGTTFYVRSTMCQMAEVWEKDSPLIYCGTLAEEGLRVEAFSGDDGLTFDIPREVDFWSLIDKSLKMCSSCQGGVVSFPAQEEGTPDESQTPNKWLLFSHPTSNYTRSDLGVYVNTSPSDPKAWSKPQVIYKGPIGHSDLSYIGGGYFACVFEVGRKQDCIGVELKIFHYNDIKPDAEETCICTIC